ncbi:MAG: N-acetyl-alpha-D-glucosaminyl L-malate synthase BshA [Acidobacteria bacterium]|nr:N-acetyl-alpha-D-glucosaminyl L-malate synthase BshA [Acidobacteriota bacterium]
MNVGIICYASIGGSGIIATELGKALAARGHRVHIMSADMPFRLGQYQPGLTFHRVEAPTYPLFREPQYLLSLANQVVRVAREARLDIVHPHYAIPHATAAYLARQLLLARDGRAPKIVTTLHGTDITLLGSDPSFAEIVAFSIEQSDGVTAVSESLAADTRRQLGIAREIRVIPNFINCDIYQRVDATVLRERLAPNGEALIVHVSNFRPVKRVTSVVDVFARVRHETRARLLLVGDGPDAPVAMRLARELGVERDVEFLGEQDSIVPILSAADVFLLPSAQESFGLAALEAMACGVPVVASRVGGVPEVVQDGVTGFLHGADDYDGMAQSAIRLVRDRDLWLRMSADSRTLAHTRYCDACIVPTYERFYEALMDQPRR